MPQLKDAPMFLGGTVISLEPLTEFGSSKPAGLRVVVQSGDGYASVKIREELVGQHAPSSIGGRVAWMVRPMFWERETGSGMAVSFVRPVDHADVDYLAASIGAKGQKAAATA